MKFVYEKIDVSHGHSFLPVRWYGSDFVKFIHKNFELNHISSGSGRRIVGAIFPVIPRVRVGPNIFIVGVMDRDDGHGECIVPTFMKIFRFRLLIF